MEKSKKLAKKVTALALSATLCAPIQSSQALWPFGKSRTNRILTANELTKKYTEEEMANFAKDEREQIFEFQREMAERRVHDLLSEVERLRKENADGNASEIRSLEEEIAANGAVVVTSKASEGLAKAAKSFLPIVATIFILKYSGDILEQVKNFWKAGKNEARKIWSRLTQRGLNVRNYYEVISRIEKRLRNELVGQDEAIDKIIKIMTGYFESVLEAEIMGKKFEGGLTLYLTGEPGTGKSTTMKIISEELNLGTCTMRMSDAVEDKGNGATTVAARFLKPVIEDNGKTKVSIDTPLSLQISSGIPTLYCFDEIDKMRNLDSIIQKTGLRNESGKIMGGSIDEMIRNFGDTGQMNGVNISGSILIVTSNETQSQLKELESSLYSRYSGCNVVFKQFNSEDYKEIMNRKISKDNEVYRKRYNINSIVWDDSALNYYSKKFEKENVGARGVETLNIDVKCALKNYDIKLAKNADLTIKYDDVSDKLYIEKL